MSFRSTHLDQRTHLTANGTEHADCTAIEDLVGLRVCTTCGNIRWSDEGFAPASDVVRAVRRLRNDTNATNGRGRQRAPKPARSLGWESLRESEHRVAELVAVGLTNREIGASLFLSRHTIDSHLRQIFRKLDISSRVELTRLVVLHTTVVK
jgi:DNA-binding CsgD family transcriptional regulator